MPPRHPLRSRSRLERVLHASIVLALIGELILVWWAVRHG